MPVMKEMVAGAARSLWMDLVGPKDGLQEKLGGAFGASIVFSEAKHKLGCRFSGLSPEGFAMLSRQRWRAAEAAQYLFMTYGTHSGWLMGSRAGQIIDVCLKVQEVKLRDSSVADAAQWMHLNRVNATEFWLRSRDGDVIKRVRSMAQSYGDRLEVKNYSLSDLRRAYDMGFGNSGQGWNQEIHPDYLDKETYQAERHEALREFN